MINFRRMEIKEAKEGYPELWKTVKAVLTLADEETTLIVSLITDVCYSCYNDTIECQCWNDE